jgi:hypothetical protein
MAADFRSAPDIGGVRVTVVEPRLLRGERVFPRAEWAKIHKLRPAVRALDALIIQGLAGADDMGILLPHGEAAGLSPEIADLIRLPPLAPVSLRLAFDGRVETPEGAIRLRWADRNHREIRPERIGLMLSWGDERARLSAPLFRLVEAVDAYNATRRQPVEQRVTAWMPLQEGLRQTLGTEVSADGYAATLTIYQAGSFALDVRETPAGVDFEPVLMARAKATTLDDDAPAEEIGGNVGLPPASGLHDAIADALLPPDDHRAFVNAALARPGPARDAYVVGRNRYVLIEPHLKRALDVVKSKRAAPADERRSFVRNPRSALADSLGSESDEGPIAALFVETQQYSERVMELGVWERPKLPWLTKRGHAWLPEGGWVDDAGAPAEPPVLAPEERRGLAQSIAQAKESGASHVLVRNVPVPSRKLSACLARASPRRARPTSRRRATKTLQRHRPTSRSCSSKATMSRWTSSST